MIEIKALDNQVNKSKVSIIPKPPFTMMICASKGGGKSTLILNMLLNPQIFRNKFNQIYIMSPTATLDSKTDVLRRESILLKNRALYNRLKRKMRNEILSSDIDFEDFNDIPTNLDDSNFIDNLDLDFIEDKIDEQRKIIETYGKNIADHILFVLDDLASETKTFMSARFKRLVFLSRHYKISIIMTTQAYFSIPKAIRLNNSQLILFETGNEKELKTIHEENSSLSFNEFIRLYNECIDVDFGFLMINYQNPKKYRYSNQFKFFIE